MRPTKGGSDGCEDKTCEPPRKRHKGNTVSLSSEMASGEVPTKEELLNCITDHVAQYLCQDLAPIITDYAHVTYLDIISEDSVMRFDNATRTWTVTEVTPKQLLSARYSHGVGVLNGKLYAVGGFDHRGNRLCSVECYDGVSTQWTTVACMNTSRRHHGVCVFKGKLYAVGGFDGNDYLSSVECYDDVSKQWTTVASMNNKRWGNGVGVLKGKLYAVGGYDGNNCLNSVECYDDVKNQWTTVASMNIARACHRVGVVNGKLYAVGGSNDNDLTTVECYDDVLNTWALVPEMSLDNIV